MRYRLVFVLLACACLYGCPPFGMYADNDYDTLKRPDGTPVYCLRVPPEVVNKSTSLNVDATLLKQQIAKVTAGLTFDPTVLIKTSPSIADYRVLNRRLCLDYASGIYTPAEYKIIQEKILPAIQKQAETNARVDSVLETAKVVDLGDKRRLVVTFRIKPVTADNLQAANVIYAIAVAHDEGKLPAGHESAPSSLSCAQVASCLGYHLWDWSKDPVIVRGGLEASGPTFDWTLDVPSGVKAVRVFWEMYQREATNGRCIRDDAKPAPEGGIPFLKVVDESGSTVKDGACIRSYGDSVIQV